MGQSDRIHNSRRTQTQNSFCKAQNILFTFYVKTWKHNQSGLRRKWEVSNRSKEHITEACTLGFALGFTLKMSTYFGLLFDPISVRKTTVKEKNSKSHCWRESINSDRLEPWKSKDATRVEMKKPFFLIMSNKPRQWQFIFWSYWF